MTDKQYTPGQAVWVIDQETDRKRAGIIQCPWQDGSSRYWVSIPDPDDPSFSDVIGVYPEWLEPRGDDE